MKCTKHYEGGRVYVYVEKEEGVTDCISFKSEKEMKRLGECLTDLARIGGTTVEITDGK